MIWLWCVLSQCWPIHKPQCHMEPSADFASQMLLFLFKTQISRTLSSCVTTSWFQWNQKEGRRRPHNFTETSTTIKPSWGILHTLLTYALSVHKSSKCRLKHPKNEINSTCASAICMVVMGSFGAQCKQFSRIYCLQILIFCNNPRIFWNKLIQHNFVI